jgi:hypothetical protein
VGTPFKILDSVVCLDAVLVVNLVLVRWLRADKGLCNEDMHLDNTPVSISTEVNPVITRPKRAFLQDAPFPVFVACHAPIV